MLLDFFEAIFGDHTGLVPVGRMTNYDGGIRKLNKTEWFKWPEEQEELVSYCEEFKDEDVYFSPQLYSTRKRTKDHVITAPVLWADADTADPDKFKLSPSIVVESSPNKYQLYWFLDENHIPSWMERASKRIAYAHREEGCDTGWALTKYLRVPGTTNTKYDEHFEVTHEIVGTTFADEDVVASYGDPSEVSMRELNTEFPTHLPSRSESVKALEGKLTPQIADLLTKTPVKDWSTALWTLECSLARAKVPIKDAFVLIKHSACNKYKRDGRSEEDLWLELCRAYETIDNDNYSIAVPDPEEPLSKDDLVGKPKQQMVKLLSEHERKQIFTDTFVERYTEWASTKTRADRNYHVMSAQCLLATVFADFGHAVPQFGKLRLNMWFMLLGQTTKTYKTTARKQMLAILRKLEDDIYQYDLGSDATTEGLLEDLATRPDRSGLFYRDEAQNMIADTQGSKSYLAGFHTTLTELYDGNVRGRTRAGGKKQKTVGTSLSMYLMGVPNEMARNLTVDDFKSGFLARMLFYIGRPGPKDRLKQSAENEEIFIDREFDHLVDALMLARRYWEHTCTAPGDTVPIICQTNAWERFNDLLDDLDRISDGNEIMTAAAHRMGMSTLKMACLLAMVGREDKVSLRHMLTAINYCELWYSGLQEMSAAVASTLWEGQLDEVIAEVASNGRLSYSALYRKFRGLYKPRQFMEIITALVDAGELRQIIDSNHNQILEIRQ